VTNVKTRRNLARKKPVATTLRSQGNCKQSNMVANSFRYK